MDEALLTFEAGDLEPLLHEQFDPQAEVHELAKGVGASPGAAKGEVVFTAEDAVRRVRALSTKVTECRALLTFARVLLRSEGAGARGPVEAALGRTLALVAETGAGLYEPQIRLELAELARLTGDEDARRRELSQARRLLGGMGCSA